MKINFAQHMTKIDGTEMVEAPGKPLTLRRVATEALNFFDPAGTIDKPTPEEKYNRFKLAVKLNNGSGDIVEITPEEAATIKQCIGRIYAPEVMGRSWEMLNG